jgi:hypothetical protein
MKLDKDTVVKHQFWFLLGLFGLVWVIALTWQMVSAGTIVSEPKKAYDSTLTAVKGAHTDANNRPKNERFLVPWDAHKVKFEKEKTKVWHQAWELQKGMVTWPGRTMLYPTVQFGDQEPRSYGDTLWYDQVKELDKIVLIAPTEFKDGRAGFARLITPTTGTGGVRGGEGDRPRGTKAGGMGVRRPTTGGNDRGDRGGVGGDQDKEINKKLENFWENKTPTPEEIWLAQEDFWVKRDLLKIVEAVNQSVARFHRVSRQSEAAPKDMPAETFVARYVYENSTWRLDLVIEKVNNQLVIGKHSTITNIHASKRTLPLANLQTKKPLTFLLREGQFENRFGQKLPQGRADKLEISGEPLAYGQSWTFREVTKPDPELLKGPFSIEQVFDWYNAPVKRLDDLAIAYASHRNADKPLKPGLWFPKKEEDKPKEEAQPNPNSDRPPGTGSDTAKENTDVTEENQLIRNRYVYVTEQCRHLPVALVLVVDQAYVQEVLIAVKNSRLRIQTTQVAWQHVDGVGPNGASNTTKLGTTDRPPPRGDLGTGTEAEKLPPDDPNLVELTVYGIASLYDRPPAPEKKEGTEQSGK